MSAAAFLRRRMELLVAQSEIRELLLGSRQDATPMLLRITAEFDYAGLEDQLLGERKKVDVASHDFSVRELVRMLEEGELSISPEYQRKYRWQADVASTLIESIFLGLPVPPIFVATNEGFQWEVVDGLQRLSTLLYFVASSPEHLALINRSEPLKLQNLQKLEILNGVVYGDLSISLQRYFGRQPLQVISLTDKSNRSVRFDLFERLNAGAISLSAQEVRACIYGGPFNDFIEELSVDSNFQGLLKLQELKRNDGTAAEEVLKFFAYKNARDSFDGRVKDFLNDFSARSVESFDYARERRLFQEAFAFLHSVTEGPFVRSTTPVTPLVQLEACAVAIGEIIGEGRDPVGPADGWIEDSELVDSSTGGSNTRAKLNRRMKRARELFDAS